MRNEINEAESRSWNGAVTGNRRALFLRRARRVGIAERLQERGVCAGADREV